MRQIILKNEQGMAMFVAIMMLSLGSSFALLAWQVSSTELEISRYSESKDAAYTLAESGIEKVISWVGNPSASPNEAFFEDLPETNCNNNADDPDYLISDHSYLTDPDAGPFKALKGMGEIIVIYFYRPTHPDGICTVGVLAKSIQGGKQRVEVELTINPLGAISAGIQGRGNIATPSPVWLHWGKIQYTESVNLGMNILKVPKKDDGFMPNPVDGSPYDDDEDNYDENKDYLMELHVEAEVDPALPDPGNDRSNVKEGESVVLDPIVLNDIKRFIKQYGESYIVSDMAGMLKDSYGNSKSFDDLFGPEEGDELPTRHLVLIETDDQSSTEPLQIEGGPYRGYFYFLEDMDIRIDNLNNDPLPLRTVTPPLNEDDIQPPDVDLSDLNLDGFFYVGGKAEIQDSFKAFGALYAKEGFTGSEATNIELWYNSALASSNYSGVRRITPLAGTWKTPLSQD